MSIQNDQLPFLTIRPIALMDYSTVLSWSKDELFCTANGWERNRDAIELYQWWQHCVTNTADDFIRKGLEYDGELIGYADLACIKNGRAEIGIAIGKRTLWGNGIGSAAAKIIMNDAYVNLGITVFDAETHEANIRSRKMLEKIGFKERSRHGSEAYLGVISTLIQYEYK